MLSLPPSVCIFVAREPCDMRKYAEQAIEDTLRAIDTETDVSKLTPWAWKARKTAEAELNSPGE